MAQSKKAQNDSETFSDLFILFAKEFWPVLAQAGAKFVQQAGNHVAQQDDRQSRTEGASEDEVNDTTDRKQSDNANDEATYANDDAYDDADEFVKQSQNRVASIASAVVLNQADVVYAVKGLLIEAGEVRKFEAVQETKRADIAARRDIAIATIEAQKQALQLYLEKSFDERKSSFDKLFAVVDHSLETDNMQELALGLQGILTLADSSPFKDLESVEATRAALADPDHEWNF